MNPTAMIKLMSAKNEFMRNHPKFMAFFKCVTGSELEEGTVIEIMVKRPGEEPLTANLKVKKSDLELFEGLKEMAGQ